LALNIILPIILSPVPSYVAKNIEFSIGELQRDPETGSCLAEPTEKLFNEYGKEGWEYIGDITWATGLVTFKRSTKVIVIRWRWASDFITNIQNSKNIKK